MTTKISDLGFLSLVSLTMTGPLYAVGTGGRDCFLRCPISPCSDNSLATFLLTFLLISSVSLSVLSGWKVEFYTVVTNLVRVDPNKILGFDVVLLYEAATDFGF